MRTRSRKRRSAPEWGDDDALIDRFFAEDEGQRSAAPAVDRKVKQLCIGAVVATRRLLYPAAVGGDIGCGMAALRFDVAAEALAGARAAARVLAGLHATIPRERRRRADLPPWPPGLDPGEAPSVS